MFITVTLAPAGTLSGPASCSRVDAFNDKRRDARAAKIAGETDATADIATPGNELKNL
ncbi:MAG: hypothetical protein NVSMB43_06510 [Pseudarthrobacter sp.]